MAASSAAAVSQLSCFSSIHRKLQLHRYPSTLRLPPRPKLLVCMSVEGRSTDASSSEIETSYAADDPKQYVEQPIEPYSTAEEPMLEEKGSSDTLKVYGAAKIHDFCFGIPYGGLVLSGGFLGFIFSRNPTTLGTGLLFGGALLALSTFSLKIWRQGKSSLPFVLGQAVLSAILFWKNFQAYSLTKRLIPTGFFAAISAGMLLFYLHVMISGGNPPPKKLQASATA